MAEQIRVFVSSDMTELENERETAVAVIRGLTHRPLLFELLPALSQPPSDAYLDNVRECHIFALILWRSYTPAVQEEFNAAVKHAKPVLIFLKDLRGDERHSDDLARFIRQLEGREPAAIRTTFRKFRGLTTESAGTASLSECLREALAEQIGKFYKNPRVTATRSELYELGADIIRTAQKRLYIVQRTPALFLGSRPYLAMHKKWFEEAFLKELTDWINSATADAERKLLYLFDPVATCAELQAIKQHNPTLSEQFLAGVASGIARYKEIENASGERLRFSPLRHPFSGPMTVGDNRFAIWILGKEAAVSLSQENQLLAKHLAEQLDQHVDESVPYGTILRELGLAVSSS